MRIVQALAVRVQLQRPIKLSVSLWAIKRLTQICLSKTKRPQRVPLSVAKPQSQPPSRISPNAEIANLGTSTDEPASIR